MKIFLAILFTSLCITFSGCSDSDPVNPPAADLNPYWEMYLGSDSVLTHHYGFELAVSNGQITGTAQILDSNDRHHGTVAGTIVNDIINVTVDFDIHEYDFTFNGTIADDIISGKLIFTQFTDAGNDTLDANLVNTFNHALVFVDADPPNPYLLRPVFISPSPTGPPVIFVHGMGGTIAEWDSILDVLTYEFKTRHNVYCFQYDWRDSLMINGRALRDSLFANELYSPIIIAHSMGGLVSRAYVASGGAVTKLVTLGTPHRGTALADIVYLAESLNKPGPKDMKPNGQFINNLMTNTLDEMNRDKYFCIAGRMGGSFQTVPPYKWIWNEPYYKDALNGIVCIGWKLLLPKGENDGLVNEWSALFHNGGVNYPLDVQLYVDHMHLVYPSLAPEVVNYINGL